MTISGISGLNPAMVVQPVSRDDGRDQRRVNESRVADQDNNRQQMNAQSAPTNTQAEAQLASKRAQAAKEGQVVTNDKPNDRPADTANQANQMNLSGGKTRGALVDLLA